MKKIFLLLVIALSSKFSHAQTDPNHTPVHKVIIEFFEGISNLDEKQIKSQITPDFLLLEVGEVWTVDTLMNLLNKNFKGRAYKRINKLDFFRTDLHQDIAWVSYHNEAEIALDDKKFTIRWLESAVLRKINGEWKMSLMHSTRVNK